MFIAKHNNKIILVRDTRKELENSLKLMIYDTIEETDIKYELFDGEYLAPEEVEAKQEEVINHLTCTALDLVSFIKNLGVEDSVILKYLNDNPSIQLQLTLCKDVYCGVVRQLCPIKITEDLSLTDEQIVNFFKQKHNIS